MIFLALLHGWIYFLYKLAHYVTQECCFAMTWFHCAVDDVGERMGTSMVRRVALGVDLHGSKPLISLVPITCTVYC